MTENFTLAAVVVEHTFQRSLRCMQLAALGVAALVLGQAPQVLIRQPVLEVPTLVAAVAG